MLRLDHVLQVEIGRSLTVVYAPEARATAAPTLVVSTPSASTTVVLTAVTDDVAVAVTGYHTLGPDPDTPAEPPDATAVRGLVGDRGGTAWLDLGADGVFPVRVMSVDGSGVVTLADATPRLRIGAVGRLYWNLWTGTIASGALGATPVRTGRWVARYTSAWGGDHPGSTETEAGPARVIRTIWTTGVTAETLAGYAPRIADVRPAGQWTWGEQIDVAFARLFRDVDRRLRDRSPVAYADQTIGSEFRRAHILRVIADLAADKHIPRDLVQAEEAYEKELSAALDALSWIDADDDGVVDADEAPSLDPTNGRATFYSHGEALGAAYDAGTATRPSLDWRTSR